MVWSVSINKRFFDHHDVLARLAEFFFSWGECGGWTFLDGNKYLKSQYKHQHQD